MWGNPEHLAEVARKIRGKESDSKNVIPGEFHVLVANTNSDHYTYDGVDHGGERVAEEVRPLTIDWLVNPAHVTTRSFNLFTPC